MVRSKESGPVIAGWRLMWGAHPVLWGVYAVNLVLAVLSSLGTMAQLGGVLDHSLAADRLYHGFDIAYFLELVAHPDIRLPARTTGALPFAAMFLVFMVFATGGILQAYLIPRRFGSGEFFQACGAFCWRFIRLMLWLIALLIPFAALASGLSSISDQLSSNSPYERLGFWIEVAGYGLIAIALMIVRLWFDMAQVLVVAENRPKMAKALVHAFRLTFSNLPALFWLYFRLSLIAWAGTVFAVYAWIKLVPPSQVGIAFLLGQFIAFLWLATRLWQRASEVAWYEQNRPQPVLLTTRTEQRPVVSEVVRPETPGT